ncbi:MAG: MFS transporter [Acidobacteria bacterium RIFCSPLOWO2_12_FULL_67_14]|nr:MAG: MFS transporter [Acidobacteria bacterium RIFCSPLOWO2_02_FULL_67_21]OFW38418.1 MAG: MFS transporter [Acidobacteria bacterium RIFCSPLOWO2_12_FULL_67_14]
MTTVHTHSAAAPLTPVQWLICVIASVGFAFDSYELLMLPLIVRPALADLLGVPPNSLEVNAWVGTMQYVPAVAGGIFGLLGGYLTDLLGRRRVLVWSILLYGFSAMAAGYASTVEWLLFWRCCTFVGVCVEFVAAVAWLSELFPNVRQREHIVGYTQAFGSIGGLMVTGAYYLIVTNAEALPMVRGTHEAWRYTLISGVIPAIPLMLIRPFLPESPTWRAKKAAGTLKRPSFAALFTPEFRRTTIVTTVMMACAYAAAFGAIQQMPRIVPGLEEVRQLERTAQEQTISGVQSFQELGGLAGRLLLAYLAAIIISRRRLLWVFQIPGLVLVPLVYFLVPSVGLSLAQWGIFLVGMATIAQFSFWGNYLPRVYPTHLRGTGESFAANVGGRMIGTMGALVTVSLVSSMPGDTLPVRLAYASAVVGTTAYLIGVVASRWLPEPKQEALPD